MSNRPKIKGKPTQRAKQGIQKLQTPVKIRMYHHIGDMSGCGTIRVIQPAMILNNYFSRDYQFESIYNNRYMPHQNAYKDNSIITFQRSAGQQQLDMVRHFKQMNPGKQMFYEIDDNLFDIPEWNFAHKFYNAAAESIKTILRIMDGVICSTEHLKKRLLRYNRNINVSPNHLPKFIWGDAVEKEVEYPLNRKTRILYAGSHNHFDTTGSDKGDFSPALIDFVSKTLDKYQWMFVGGIPASLKGNKNIIHHEWRSCIEYPRFLKHLSPDICLAPLENNEFNRSKSNIKALEACALGVPLVSSNVTPYEGLPYAAANDEIFIGMIETLANSLDLRQYAWAAQYDKLKDQLFWEDNDYANLFDYVNQHLRLYGKEL